MKNKELKNQLDDLHEQIVALDEKIMSFVAKVKHLPQGMDRWDLEEWIIAECNIDPKIIRTKPSWTKKDWLLSAIELKDAARRYRGAGKLAEAVACETDAKVAEERAAWMA
jgi:uncharacterized glyoxalase superfamily metalloenzyme YdcJ